jgi:CheY-like chemotaxis protein
MKSCYFLPNNTGIDKFDSINDKLKSVLSNITEVIPFPLDELSDCYPENYKKDIPELIFVPTIFDYRNGISYQGVELALRWYFHLVSLNYNPNFNIVLLGTEDKSAFFINCIYSNFLKCSNVDYLENSLENVNQYINDYQTKEFDRKAALDKIDLIGIRPPSSYKSHHSIANEWSILRWAKALKLDTVEQKELKKIETNIESSLYYKYLNTKYPISQNVEFKNKKLLKSGKILFIDDEIEKGWDAIFKTICIAKTYSSFGKDFKNWDQNKIIEESLNKAKDADLIILDLRLHDDDFDENDPQKITGYKLLEKIKEHNKGIQVIIFSATNKIWNLQALQSGGADGFIIKESPEQYVDENFTIQSISNIYKTIDMCLDMIFLKEIFVLKKKIEIHLNDINNKGNAKGLAALGKIKLKDEIKIQLEIVYSCLKNATEETTKENYYNMSFVSIYKIIELVNDYYVEERVSNYYLKSSNILVDRFNPSSMSPSTIDKILSIIKNEFKLNANLYKQKLLPFNTNRINIFHPKEQKDYYKTTKDDNINFLRLITDIVLKIV